MIKRIDFEIYEDGYKTDDMVVLFNDTVISEKEVQEDLKDFERIKGNKKVVLTTKERADNLKNR